MSRILQIAYPTPTGIRIFGYGPFVSGPLPINFNETGSYTIPFFQRQLAFAGPGNLSGINFTIIGYDIYNNLITEVLVGPNANVVESVRQYHKVLSITPSAPSAGLNLVIDYGQAGTSTLIPMYDLVSAGSNISIGTKVTGTVVYSINVTLDPITSTAPTFYPLTASLTNANSNQLYFATNAFNALQITVTADEISSLLTTIYQPGLGL